MQLDLYPDKAPDTGASYLRSVFRELRQKFGPEILSVDGPHRQSRYRLGSGVYVDLDARELQEALRRAALSRALSLYRGPFLPELHESEWASSLREELKAGLCLELRSRQVSAPQDLARYRAELQRFLN